MKTEPTFGFVPRDGHEKLYWLEEEVSRAVSAVQEHRETAYNEDRWSCALPEVMHYLLDGFEQHAVTKAVLHWIDVQLHPDKRPRNFGAAKPNDALKRELLKLVR